MSPIPRCNLRLPNDVSEADGGENSASASEASAEGERTRSSETTALASTAQDENKTNGGKAAASDESEEYGRVPESAHDRVSRDSAEVLEGASEFKTSVTRDSAEAREHYGTGTPEGLDESLDESLNACELLKRCKDEVERATANGECEQMKCPNLEAIGTPGDVCARFCHDRQDSPKSAKSDSSSASLSQKYCKKWGRKSSRLECDVKISSGDRSGKAKRPKTVCKGTYRSGQVYTSLWGSGQAIDYRKRLEHQMRKKRKLLEKMHRKEFVRRQKMRRRAKEKRAALKRKDQSKISTTTADENLRINKAYDLRLNYNKQLPLMPVAMRQHMDKFKKPPFKQYVTAKKRYCAKRIDEFDKLRVPDNK